MIFNVSIDLGERVNYTLSDKNISPVLTICQILLRTDSRQEGKPTILLCILWECMLLTEGFDEHVYE